MSAIVSFQAQSNLAPKPPARVAFSREELRQLLNVYSRRVAAGEWRDYAIDHGPNRAIFSIFRHTADVPLYKVEKIRRRGAGPTHRYVLSRGCEQLRSGPSIAAVVSEIERRPRLVAVRQALPAAASAVDDAEMFLLCSHMGRLKRHMLEQADDATSTPDTAAKPPRPPMRIGDLAAADGLVFCWCNRCSHHANLAAKALVARLGPHTTVPDVSAHLNCSGCGSRDVATRPHWAEAGVLARTHDFSKNQRK